MYVHASWLSKLPVISLQTGAPVGIVVEPLISLLQLELVGFRCETAEGPGQILLATDIRQYGRDCLLIDHEDELSDPDDLVRLHDPNHPISNPLRLRVVADTGRKLGRVSDYSLNLETNFVQQLETKLGGPVPWKFRHHIIDRTQIIDITPNQITVRDATVRAGMLPRVAPDLAK